MIECEDCLVGGCWKDSWNPFVKLSCQNKGAAELHQPPAEPGHHGLGLLYAAKDSTSTHSPRLPCFHCVGRSIYPPPCCRRSCPTHLGPGMPPHGRRSTCCWVGESSWTVAWMWSTWQFQVRFDLCYPTLLKNILPADSDGAAKVDGIHETRTCSWGEANWDHLSKVKLYLETYKSMFGRQGCTSAILPLALYGNLQNPIQFPEVEFFHI